MRAVKKPPPAIRPIARNRRAFHDFEIVEQVEAGIVLLGTEVKSLREGKVSFNDSYARHRDGELFLMELYIPPYANASWGRHEPTRPRKLLLHKRELRQLQIKRDQKGMSLIPLELYFSRGYAKLKLGIGKGRKKADKRQALKRKQDQRSMERHLKG